MDERLWALQDAQLDRLHDARTEAEQAYTDHLNSGVVAWREGHPPGLPERSIDGAFVDRLDELRQVRDRAEQALRDFYARYRRK